MVFGVWAEPEAEIIASCKLVGVQARAACFTPQEMGRNVNKLCSSNPGKMNSNVFVWHKRLMFLQITTLPTFWAD